MRASAKDECDLLAGVVILSFALEQPRNCQARFHPVAIRRLQRAREALHGGLTVSQREQRVAGVQQNRRLVGAQFLGRGDVLQRPLAVVQLGVSMRQRGVDQRIIGRETQRVVEGVNRILVAALAIFAYRPGPDAASGRRAQT